MDTRRTEEHRAIITRYLDQPDRLPVSVRERMESAMGGQPVQLYALTDLDASLRFSRNWLGVGPRHLTLLPESAEALGARPRCIERAEITGVRKVPALSGTTAWLLGAPGEPALACLRYTHRQRKAVENALFPIEEALEGKAAAAPLLSSDADAAYAEAVASPVQEAQASVAASRYSVAVRLLNYLRPYSGRLGIGLGAAAVMTLVSLAPPYLTGYLMDKVIKPFQSGALRREEALSMAWLLVGGLGALFLLREACVWLRLKVLAILGSTVVRDIRRDLYEHLQTLSVGYFSKKQTGSLISRVTELDNIWEFIAFGAVDATLAVITLLGLSGILLWLDWRLGLLILLPVPVLLWAIYRYGERMHDLSLRGSRKWSRVMEVVSDTLPGIRVVKAFHQEEREKARYRERLDVFLDQMNLVHDTWTGFWPLLMLGIHGAILVAWCAAVPRLLGGPGVAELSLGTFVAFLLYMAMFFQPIEVLGLMARMLNRATSSAQRTFEILDARPMVADAPGAKRLEPVKGHVSFEEVSFSYDGVRPVLKGVSLEARPGEMLGLVGPSGAGKTTVVNLLARFYDVTGGRILVDGVDLRQLEMGHYHRQCAMVQQDPYLFHGTILENIRYGSPEARLEEVLAAARAANAHDFIAKLPQGYDTVVGERGHTLSGGERQRVSIARAVLTNPRLLILDEATSSVDTETEHKIQEALDRLIAGRTVFAIAHRLSTLRRATRLLVLENGRITEQGTHEELVARENGVYRKLYRLQQERSEMYAV